MTHSGGKPHQTGDKGQRYEVSYFDTHMKERRTFGWASTKDGVKSMMDSIEKHSAMEFPHVIDRVANAFLKILNDIKNTAYRSYKTPDGEFEDDWKDQDEDGYNLWKEGNRALQILYREDQLAVQQDVGEISDGYHTFNELYEFRKLYNAALFNEWARRGVFNTHKSWKHFDGKPCFGGGWFIVCASLPGGQISNHYKEQDWDLFKIPETGTALYPFDGHTTKDVIERLENVCRNDSVGTPKPGCLMMLEP